MKEYELLSGEKLSLEDLTTEEKQAIGKFIKRIQRDPDGDSEGEYFRLYGLTYGSGAILDKYKRFTPRRMNETCYQVLRDIATRAGIRQGLVMAPEHKEKERQFQSKWGVVAFASAASTLKITYKQLSELLEKGEIEGEKLGNCWIICYASFEDYQKRLKKGKK